MGNLLHSAIYGPEAFGETNLPFRGRRPLPKFFAVDLFCGAGGTTRGLIDAGGYVICGVDKEASPAETYVRNNRNLKFDRKFPDYAKFDIFPKSSSYPNGQQHELVEYLAKKILPLKSRYPDIPWLFAVCAPCQPFTTLSRKQLSDERDQARQRDSRLLEEALSLIKRFHPDVVMSENVAGIRSAKYGNVWHSFEQGLIFSDYKTASNVVCASKFGVPQRRRRSILLALRTDILGDRPIGELPLSDGKVTQATVASALSNLPPIQAGERHPNLPNHRSASLSPLNLQRLKSILPGEVNKSLANTSQGDLRLACHRKTEAKFNKNCFGDTYGRMRADQPSPTITTKCYSITNGRFGHYSQDRAISLREAAALQSFKNDYHFYPDKHIAPIAKMIGNAVPPRLAEFFARHAISYLESDT